ncbi:MAG: miaA [Alphaproteobacteria bacterium]|nr:miaA [Alphaproteobacteria bacterium]
MTIEPAWIIAGPTASGKSALAVDIARACNGVVINADSMQVYREIPVLSAQPDKSEREGIPHLLYGFHPVTENYSAPDWAAAAISAISETMATGKQPILVGGSGLYFRALTEGFSPMPKVFPDIRRAVSMEYDTNGPDAFHAALAKIDPVIAARLHPTDRQRCIRAREIFEATGENLSAWQAKPKQNPAPHLSFKSLILLPERKILYDRINRRFESMVQNGALDEAAAMNTLDLHPDMTGAKAVGLQGLRDALTGKMPLGEAIERGQIASRQYAKRQYTWFRNQALPARHFLQIPDSTAALTYFA